MAPRKKTAGRPCECSSQKIFTDSDWSVHYWAVRDAFYLHGNGTGAKLKRFYEYVWASGDAGDADDLRGLACFYEQAVVELSEDVDATQG